MTTQEFLFLLPLLFGLALSTPPRFLAEHALQPEDWTPIPGTEPKKRDDKAIFEKFDPEEFYRENPNAGKDDGTAPDEQYPLFLGVYPSGELYQFQTSAEGDATVRKILMIDPAATSTPASNPRNRMLIGRRLLETLEAANQATGKNQETNKAGFYFDESPDDFAATVSNYPQRTVGFLSNGCTASLFHRRLLFTAAHCLYNTKTDVWTPFDGLTWSAAKTNDGNSGVYNVDLMMIPVAYAQHSQYSPVSDWGIARVKADSKGVFPGSSLGWFGYGWRSSLVGISVVNLGYPQNFWFTMRQDSCKFTTETATVVRHRCDINVGSSGGPLYDSTGPYILADQSGHCSSGGCENAAARITSGVFNTMNWCRAAWP